MGRSNSITASAVSFLRSPYLLYERAVSSGVDDVDAARIDKRLDIPGFSLTSNRTSPSLSVTALFIFLLIDSLGFFPRSFHLHINGKIE